jgi:small subunit ribosomal protein S20
MPQIASAKKALRQSLKRKKSNQSFKKLLKDLEKKYLSKPTEEGLRRVFSALDKAVKKNLVHKNKAARVKSNLCKKIVTVKKKVEKKVTKGKKM